VGCRARVPAVGRRPADRLSDSRAARPGSEPTITAHRFRHTVGTQLAERGARLQTIMSVLGHKSVQMALVYANVSDPAVLDDYRTVLGPDATIAGPSASAVRNRELSPGTVDLLKDDFFRTELELSHCLRLPAEGPCVSATCS
jgi:Phage integrase family